MLPDQHKPTHENRKDAEFNRHEFKMMSDMVQEHHKRIRDIERFIELAPNPSEHHDDHLYVGQSRERAKILIHSFMDNVGKFLFIMFVLGIAAWAVGKVGVTQ